MAQPIPLPITPPPGVVVTETGSGWRRAGNLFWASNGAGGSILAFGWEDNV
jgi:hypothetical protein